MNTRLTALSITFTMAVVRSIPLDVQKVLITFNTSFCSTDVLKREKKSNDTRDTNGRFSPLLWMSDNHDWWKIERDKNGVCLPNDQTGTENKLSLPQSTFFGSICDVTMSSGIARCEERRRKNTSKKHCAEELFCRTILTGKEGEKRWLKQRIKRSCDVHSFCQGIRC